MELHEIYCGQTQRIRKRKAGWEENSYKHWIIEKYKHDLVSVNLFGIYKIIWLSHKSRHIMYYQTFIFLCADSVGLSSSCQHAESTMYLLIENWRNDFSPRQKLNLQNLQSVMTKLLNEQWVDVCIRCFSILQLKMLFTFFSWLAPQKNVKYWFKILRSWYLRRLFFYSRNWRGYKQVWRCVGIEIFKT